MAGYAGIQSDVAVDWMMPLGRVPGTKSRRSGSRFGSKGVVRCREQQTLVRPLQRVGSALHTAKKRPLVVSSETQQGQSAGSSGADGRVKAPRWVPEGLGLDATVRRATIAKRLSAKAFLVSNLNGRVRVAPSRCKTVLFSPLLRFNCREGLR